MAKSARAKSLMIDELIVDASSTLPPLLTGSRGEYLIFLGLLESVAMVE